MQEDSLVFFPAVQEALDLLRSFPSTSTFPFDMQVRAHGTGVLGLVILNGAVAGALVAQPNFQHTAKGKTIYWLYNSEGTRELDSEQVELALSKAQGQSVRKRNLSMTDADHQYLTQLGGGNASAGLRVVVEMVKMIRAQYPSGARM